MPGLLEYSLTSALTENPPGDQNSGTDSEMLEFENNNKKRKDDGDKSDKGAGAQEDGEECRQKVI